MGGIVAGISGTHPERFSRLRITVLSYIVRRPLASLTWHNLQYTMDLAWLGHDMYFAEDSDDFPSCYNPVKSPSNADPMYGLKVTTRASERVGLGDRWAHCDVHPSRRPGLSARHIADIYATADLFLNLPGMNPTRPWHMEVPVRVLIDTDPAYTQIRYLVNRTARNRALQGGGRHGALYKAVL
jgi:hypothetical protein